MQSLHLYMNGVDSEAKECASKRLEFIRMESETKYCGGFPSSDDKS